MAETPDLKKQKNQLYRAYKMDQWHTKAENKKTEKGYTPTN